MSTSPVNSQPVELNVIFRFTEFEQAIEVRKLIIKDRHKSDVSAIISALIHDRPILVKPIYSRSTALLINSLIKNGYMRAETGPLGQVEYYLID